MPRKKHYPSGPNAKESLQLVAAGLRVGRLGAESSTCPYRKGNAFYSAWYDGWSQGAKEFIAKHGYVVWDGDKMSIDDVHDLTFHGFSNRQASMVFTDNIERISQAALELSNAH